MELSEVAEMELIEGDPLYAEWLARGRPSLDTPKPASKRKLVEDVLPGL